MIARARQRPVPVPEVDTEAPFAAVADNGRGVIAECASQEDALRAARQLFEDGEPLPILQYVNGRRALGSYGDIGA